MKKAFFILSIFLLIQSTHAQTAFVSMDNEGNKVIKGFMSVDSISADPAFGWFAKNKSDYKPYAKALETLTKNKDSLSFIFFAGTWCHDSHFVLPRFYALTEAAGIPQNKITLLGVDRNKKTVQNLSETFNITLTPTILVLKGGKEIGRVIEYGKGGMFDKELGEIVAAAAIH